MKKILTILLVVSIGTLALMGCSLIFGATYSVTDGGFCYEVTTKEPSVIILLELIDGVVKEPCDINAAASCTATSSEYNQELTNYYTAEHLALITDLEEACAADDGIWKTY